MIRPQSLLKLVLLLVTLPLSTHAQAPWTGIIAPIRATNWSSAGISGGIPSASWAQCGSTIAAYGTAGSPASPAAIQNAINACTANHYVQLGVGSFYLTGSFHVKGKNNVEIRGMGGNSTFVYFYGNTDPVSGDNCGGIYSLVCFESAEVNWNGGMSNGPVNWTAGYAQGTNVITLTSVPNLKIGNPVILDQLSTPSDVGAILERDDATGGHPFVSPGNAGSYSAQGSSLLPGRDQVHVYTVAGCNGSTTIGTSCSGTNVAVTIDPALEEANWSGSLTPQAWWATTPDRNVGIQNVALDASNLTGGNCSFGSNNSLVGFFNVDGGWISGVRTFDACRNHHNVQYSTRITIRNSYLFLSRWSSSTSYGLECFTSSDSLFENNIIQAIAGGIVFNEGCSGWVLGYNFQINGYYTAGGGGFVIPFTNMHAANNDYNLFEGNVGSMFDGDIIHGTHNVNTVFRNRLAGQNPVCWAGGSQNNDYASYLASSWGACTGATNALQVYANNRFYNVVGNVLGTTGLTTSYKNVGGAAERDGFVMNVGVGDDHNGAVVPPDTTVLQTLMLWGNCDPVNGFSAAKCLFNSSDVPVTANLAASQQAYANAVPSSRTLPASFYYSSKPSWWPSGKAWPIIGPDVTGGNIPGTGGLAYTNPAQDCYNSLSGSTTNGTGGPFPFDANVCYSGSSLTPPTNIIVTPKIKNLM
jgi:hypothetical protein